MNMNTPKVVEVEVEVELQWKDGIPHCSACGSTAFIVTTWEEVSQQWDAASGEWGDKTGDGEIKPPHELECDNCLASLRIEAAFLRHIRL